MVATDNPERITLIEIFNNTKFDQFELTGGEETEATLNALIQAIQITNNAEEGGADWPLSSAIPAVQIETTSVEDVEFVVKSVQNLLDAQQPSGRAMTDILGKILGFSQSDGPSTLKRNAKRAKIRVPGTKGLTNCGFPSEI